MSEDGTPLEGCLFLLGATHHRAPIEVREKLALSQDSAGLLRSRLAQLSGLCEFLILNTCNRVEFYGVAESEPVIAAVCEAYCGMQDFDPAVFEGVCLNLRGVDAVRHLFEVASGLDSQMLGETEILGQVKEAYALAQSQGSTGVVLNRLFQKAFQAAKHVRSETAISIGQVSVANVAVDLAETIFGRLETIRILLIGAGEIGEKTSRAFISRGAKSLAVCSRNSAHAMELATRLGGLALPFDQRELRLSEFDIVVSATSATEIILSRQSVTRALHLRPARPLLLIDLALPRDIDSAVGDLESCYLYNLDDLAKVAEENRKTREQHARKARDLVGSRASYLWEQLGRRFCAR